MKIKKFNENKADDEYSEFQKLPYELSDEAEKIKKQLIKQIEQDKAEQEETEQNQTTASDEKLNEIGEKIDADENWVNTDEALKLTVDYIKSWEG